MAKPKTGMAKPKTGMAKPKTGPAKPYLLSVRMQMPQERAGKVARSLAPEIGGAYERRSATRMNINKNILSLEIGAEDITALKASFNSYMKLIILCNDLQNAKALPGKKAEPRSRILLAEKEV